MPQLWWWGAAGALSFSARDQDTLFYMPIANPQLHCLPGPLCTEILLHWSRESSAPKGILALTRAYKLTPTLLKTRLAEETVKELQTKKP